MGGQRDMTLISHIALAFRVCLGLVFLLSAAPKLRRPVDFAHDVVAYKVLPGGVAAVFAFSLIPVEVFLAIALLVGWLLNIALPLATATLFSFLIAVEINLVQNRPISCGCFGRESEQISLRTLGRLILLLGITLSLCILHFTGNIVWPEMTTLLARSSLPYVLAISCLASSAALLGAWILDASAVVSLGRYLLQSKGSSGPQTRDGR